MYEEIRYSHNYLNEVICRLDYASQIVELKNNMPKKIYDIVRKYFPIAEPQDVIGTEFSINQINVATRPVINQVAIKQWVFLSWNRKNKCIIDTNEVIFSITEYSIFDDLKTAAKEIIHAVLEYYPTAQGKRFGLRYINNLQLHGHTSWIAGQFINALSAHKNEKTTKLITTLEYAVQENDINVRLIYGFNNPDYPAIMKNEEFVIDIDAYSTGIIYQEDIENYLENMHTEVQTCFEKMITDDYRNDAKKV